MLQHIIEAIKNDLVAKPCFYMKGDVLFYNNILVIPAKFTIINEILKRLEVDKEEVVYREWLV